MFLACGEALWDLFAVEGPEGLRFEAVPGGSSFNLAIGLARMGLPAGLLAGISTDPLGERLVSRLAAEGVARDYLLRSGAASPVSMVQTAPDGQPAYSIHAGADRLLTLADLPSLDGVQALHFGSFAAVVEPCGSAYAELAARAGERLVTYDPNVRLMVEPDTDLWRAKVAEWVGRADLVKVSAEDIDRLWPGASPEEVARGWLDGRTGLVVVTHGAEGATGFTAKDRIDVPARRVEVIDSVGAGDAFMAAMVAALDRAGIRSGRDIPPLGRDRLAAALGFAGAAAALTCARRGADPPTRAEAEALNGGS